MKKRNIFFTSDWHIGHAKSIEFDSRPFKDLDHMHTVLINNYNATVSMNDICYFLGDVGLYSSEITRDVIGKLKGTKILLFGNHDSKGRQYWMDIGFATTLHTASIVVGNSIVTMSHCPLRGIPREDTTNMRGVRPGENWHGEYKHKKYSIPDYGQFHLHGHIHSPNRGRSEKIQDRQYDVGVVANKYRPVSISTIESWIAKYKKENT